MVKFTARPNAVNEYGQPIYTTPDGYTIDGNGYGRMRWTLTRPDGDTFFADSKGGRLMLEMFDLASVQNHKSWERNGNMPVVGSNDQHCLVCNRPMRDEENTWVHMSTGGDLFPGDYDNWEDPGSQGAFPVGNSCKKRIPAAYLLENF